MPHAPPRLVTVPVPVASHRRPRMPALAHVTSASSLAASPPLHRDATAGSICVAVEPATTVAAPSPACRPTLITVTSDTVAAGGVLHHASTYLSRAQSSSG